MHPTTLPPTQHPTSRQWHLGAAALVFVGLYVAGALDRFWLGHLTTALVTSLTAAGTLLGVRHWRPRPRWPWHATVAALGLFALGSVLRSLYGTLGQLHQSRSPVPELVTLPGYAVFATGLYGAIRARTRNQDPKHRLDIVLDAALAALATLTVAWIFLMSRVVDAHEAPTLIRVLVAAYPPMSVFLVALATRFTFVQGRRAPLALRLVLASLTCMLAGDVVFMLVELGTVANSRLIEVPYLLACIGMAMAALHPTMRLVTEPALTNDGTSPSARLAVVSLALCVPAVVSMYPSESGTDQLVLSVIVVAMTAVAAMRMFRALREHASSEERLAYQATHDQLTDLPNRALVHQRLSHALACCDASVALLFLDIDRFKLVNDTLGHGTGDELLRAVAGRLKATMRDQDLVGRGGGDEFLVVVHDVRGLRHALDHAERIRRSFAAPFRVRDTEISVSASVGVTMQPPAADGASAETMFRDADTAMYQAKASGGDAVEPFDSSVRARINERVRLERELRHALDRDELDVWFQPVVRATDGQVCGLEALLRWSHPWLGSVRPDRFIPIAEDSGLIVEVGAWVLHRACAEVAQLRRLLTDAGELYVAVNLSARQLRDDGLIDQVGEALDQYHLPPHALCLELTESLLMENVDRTAELLGSLRTRGVRISIDDFGTGYSSLAYLKRLPVDEVKIDQSFVTDLAAGGADTSLVSAVVAIAGSFGLSTVAEGVEDEHQAERLIELGCTKAQGFLFSRPVPSLKLLPAINRLGLSESEPGPLGIGQPV